VFLEKEREELSNIQGIGQIWFPKCNIRVVFEDVWQVLEREGFLD